MSEKENIKAEKGQSGNSVQVIDSNVEGRKVDEKSIGTY